jgi:hypothetical protein
MSSKCKSATVPAITLTVIADSLEKFTTLLQSGIYIHVQPGETIGSLLASLPGFNEKYVRERVQTIFVDGLPADHLAQEFTKKETVLAISAAMPGVAGAIFRKGGIHAALRTGTAKQANSAPQQTSLNVRLKLFNVIAKERGEALLARGCFMQSKSLEKFLNYRPLLIKELREITIDGHKTTMKTLMETLSANKKIALSIDSSL